ncbi:hypothetical protein KIPB_009993, partial [Kipferlia bialata]
NTTLISEHSAELSRVNARHETETKLLTRKLDRMTLEQNDLKRSLSEAQAQVKAMPSLHMGMAARTWMERRQSLERSVAVLEQTKTQLLLDTERLTATKTKLVSENEGLAREALYIYMPEAPISYEEYMQLKRRVREAEEASTQLGSTLEQSVVARTAALKAELSFVSEEGERQREGREREREVRERERAQWERERADLVSGWRTRLDKLTNYLVTSQTVSRDTLSALHVDTQAMNQ